jgi:septum formation protein
MTTPIILASGSPRRKSLLASLGVQFTVQTSDAHEPNTGETPAAIVEGNAVIKRDDVAANVTEASIVIAADTLVFYEEHVLPKPKDLDGAHRMLRLLSGNTHQVVTGIAACHTGTGQSAVASESTDVTFKTLTDGEIERFIDIVRPLDRAGAYTVDGPGSLIVAGYRGCYQNVLGFPMVRLDALLRDFDIRLFDLMDKERAVFL